MNNKCRHYWCCEQAVYSEDTIRRWCSECGLIQHAQAKNWQNSNVGESEMWGEYPDGYPDEFRKKSDDEGVLGI